MKFKQSLFILILLFAVSLFFVREGMVQPLSNPEGGKPLRPGTSAPVITHAFAVEKGYYGYIWKIYIEAEDPDGDMLRIAAVVDQTGYGHYPADWIYLKPPYQKHFKGYIQWNTFSSKTSYLTEGTQITLKVYIKVNKRRLMRYEIQTIPIYFDFIVCRFPFLRQGRDGATFV